MKRLIGNSRAVGKVTLSFTSLIVALTVGLIVSGFILSNRIDSLQTTNSQLKNDYENLQSQYEQLNSQYQQLLSSNTSFAPIQITDLQRQIANLQTQLLAANDTIAQLKGQTGILPTYMDLGYFGGNYGGCYVLQLSLKNTGDVPITQIYVTLSSVQTNMTFTYLNMTLTANIPLPPYQTAAGRQNTLISEIGTYPLIIQATANNGTTYTYETTITAHV